MKDDYMLRCFMSGKSCVCGECNSRGAQRFRAYTEACGAGGEVDLEHVRLWLARERPDLLPNGR